MEKHGQIKMNKVEQIKKFLASLGEVKKNDEAVDGFYVSCKKCNSQNCIKYGDSDVGRFYTSCWGNAGIKCLDCGNASEIISF